MVRSINPRLCDTFLILVSDHIFLTIALYGLEFKILFSAFNGYIETVSERREKMTDIDEPCGSLMYLM